MSAKLSILIFKNSKFEMNFVQYTVFLFLQQKVVFLHQCKAVLELNHLSNDSFDKYLERLEKIKGVADNFDRTIFNSHVYFHIFFIF